MVEWQTAAINAGVMSVVQYVFWALFRRSIERLDAERTALVTRVDTLEEKRVAALEREIREEGSKRKVIYEHLEEIRLNWMHKKECEKMHAAVAAQSENFMACVMKLERVSTEVTRLVSWVEDVSREQISHGKDLSALAAQMETLKEEKHESRRAD